VQFVDALVPCEFRPIEIKSSAARIRRIKRKPTDVLSSREWLQAPRANFYAAPTAKLVVKKRFLVINHGKG
jgi:hypothetical protein